MPIRKATASDASILQAVFNQNTRTAGWCVSGLPDISLENINRILVANEILVHEDDQGQVDGWIAWTKRAVEPEVTTLTAVPSPALIPALVQLCLSMCIELEAKGHNHVIARLDPVKATIIRFLFQIGGAVLWKGSDPSSRLQTVQMMRFDFSVTIPKLQALVR